MAILAILPLTALAITTDRIATDALRQTASNQQHAVANSAAATVAAQIEGFRQVVQSYAQRPSIRAAMGRPSTLQTADASLNGHLNELRASSPNVSNALIAVPNGVVRYSAPLQTSSEQMSASEQDWYQGVIATGQPFVSNGVLLSDDDDSRGITVAAPIWSEAIVSSPVLVGILTATYDLSALDQYAEALLREEGVRISVTDRAGFLIAGGNLQDRGADFLASTPAISQALNGKDGVTIEESNGVRSVVGYAPVPNIDFAVTADLPSKEAFSGVDELRAAIGAAITFLFLLLVAGLIWLWRSLRRRERMERDLEKSYQETSNILEAAGDGFISSDNGLIKRWNSQAEEIFGWARSEVIGKPLMGAIFPEEKHAEYGEQWQELLTEGISGPVRVRREAVGVHKDGRRFPIEVVLWSSVDPSDSTMSLFVHDISNRTAAAAALAQARDDAMDASRMKSEFLANMSHEIRTPMNGVMGMSALLLQTELSSDQRDYVNTVRTSADALLTVINDILDFSKIEAGHLDLETIDFEPRTVMEEVADLLSDAAHRKGLELAVLVQPDVPETVEGDPGRVRQVLLNLANNAVKFTASGEVVLGCRVDSRDGDDVTVRFEVTDTGMGIPADQQDRLFDKFSQADTSTTRRFGGTGLGLAISRQLAELMGGQIGVVSSVGHGSTFWFCTLLKVRPKRVRPMALATAELENMRVLVVDDNETNRTILQQQLTIWNLQATCVAGANEALSALDQAVRAGRPFSIALLDYQMPEINGITLGHMIREDQRFASLRMALLTSSGQRGQSDNAERAGISAYLVKPVRQSALHDCLAVLAGLHLSRSNTRSVMTDETLANLPEQRRPHLLVAEDNPVNQKVAVRTLEKLGYRADVVSNGAEAVAAVQMVPYAAVLMDCQMPEMDGYEATRQIRRLPNEAQYIPIIAMTAAAMAEDVQACRDAGMDDFVAKPVRWDELRTALQRHVSIASGPSDDDDSAPPRDDSQIDDILDYTYVEQVKMLGGPDNGPGNDRVSAMVSMFLEHSRTRLMEATEMVNEGHLTALPGIAHSLRGSAGSFGALAFARILEDLEASANFNDLPACEALLQQARQAFSDLQSALEREFALPS